MHKTGNSILDSIEESDFEALEPHLTEVELPMKRELFAPGGLVGCCYFPKTTVVSLLRGFSDGNQVEVAVVGREGFAGLHSVLGENLEPSTGMIQYAGSALEVPSDAVKELFWQSASFQQRMLRFVYALISQISQTAACNQLHLVEQRLSRWLLAMWDRASGDELQLSHEFLALMLGVTRPRVSQSIKNLVADGAISSSRKSVRLRDRDALIRRACECYQEALRGYGDLLSARPLQIAASV